MVGIGLVPVGTGNAPASIHMHNPCQPSPDVESTGYARVGRLGDNIGHIHVTQIVPM